MEYLGDTVEQIAGEKAGIIRPEVPVFFAQTAPGSDSVIEKTAEKEGFDKINFTGSFYTDEEYPGCPYCGAKKCFVCGNCGKVSCYDGSDKVVCNWCGSNGTAADDDGKLDVSGGGF